MTVTEAVRKMTSLPASNLGIASRGLLRPGYFADVAVFDPATIQDHATFERPRQLATGVSEVFVNGVQVVHNGQHTGRNRAAWSSVTGARWCPDLPVLTTESLSHGGTA